MKAIWKKLRELGAGTWAVLVGLAVLAFALLGHSSAQERLRKKRRAQDARVLEELEAAQREAQDRAARAAKVRELEEHARTAAQGRKVLEAETKALEEEIRNLSDEELEARWRAFVAETKE